MNDIQIVAGGAGFIGSGLVRELLQRDRSDILILDDLSLGRTENIEDSLKDQRVRMIECDIANRAAIATAFASAAKLGHISEIWHLAANSDIPAGVSDPDVDFNRTFRTTYELLKLARAYGVRVFHFASSSAIYGDFGDLELHESIGPLLPISNYGAMKLASEAQISAAAEGFLDRANVFRFPNVVGIPATHGVILDFVRKLKAEPSVLRVLGNGRQQKAYLHGSDLIAAMLVVRSATAASKVQLVNIGPVDQGVKVSWIAEQVVRRVSPGATISFGTEPRGWLGDVPRFRYSVDKLRRFGWSPALNSSQAVIRAIEEIARQEGV